MSDDESCTFETKAKTIKLSPTERYSLFDQDRSLSQFKIQDQDGGGTCYANSTSAVLQSIFPQQEISYQHIAITASIDDPVSKNRSQQYVTLNEAKVAEDFTSGGLMCDAINKLKKYGGACPKKFSRLENGSSSDPLVQSRAMLGLGKYFDKVNSIKSNPEKFKQFKLEAAEIVNATKKLYGNAINECREKKKKGELSMLSALQNGLAFKAIEAQLETLQDPKKSKCSDAIIEEIKKLSLKSSVFNSDQVTLYPTKATSDKFENIISSKTDPAFFNELTSFVNGNFSSDDKRKLAIKFGKKINDVMSELVSNDKFKDICDLRKDESGNTISPITGSVGVIGNSFLNLIKSERNTPCAKFNLESFDVLLNDQKRSCTNVLPINQILTALAPLIELGQALDETLINGLTDPNSKEATQIKKLLMPECLEKKNLIPLDGLKCSTKNMCDGDKSIGDEPYTGPPHKCYDLKTSKAIVRERVLRDIQNGSAIGIGTCTKFLSEAGYKSNHCQESGASSGKHGSHEMTLTGYRCNKGKIEYEVLNSWGSGHCPVVAKDKKSGITCELKNGKNTGRFWVDEDILVDNLEDFSSLSKGK